MKKILITLLLSTFIFTVNQTIVAKRLEPQQIQPVTQGNIEYRAPISSSSEARNGIIEAWDKSTNTLLWWRQIYVVRYVPRMEKDVQDVFIKKITFSDKNALPFRLGKPGQFLVIENEKNDKYQLNLRTLQVIPLGESRVVVSK